MYDSETGIDFVTEAKDNCRPLFRYEAVQNKAKSVEEGRPIFRQIPFVTIMSPGDNINVIDTIVTEEH